VLVLLICGTAAAGPDEPGAPALPDSSNLDGSYVYLAPIGGVARTEGAWDGVFGGSVSVVRVREARWAGTLGLSVGATRFTDSDRGRVWADLLLGTRRLTGDRLMLGVGVGPMVELDDLRHARFGARARIWCHVGVVPYVGFGVLERSGSFIEAGLEVSLPALRW
jgi:hypothetical protein